MFVQVDPPVAPLQADRAPSDQRSMQVMEIAVATLSIISALLLSFVR